MRNELAYSYHTFLYPFSIKTSDITGNTSLSYDLLQSGDWKLEPYYGDNKCSSTDNDDVTSIKDAILQYNSYQYFFPRARKNLFNDIDLFERAKSLKESDIKEFWTKNIGIHLNYIMDAEDNYKYLITYIDSNGEKVTVSLDVTKLSISIYEKMNIGILEIDLAYYGEQGKNLDVVKKINDYGRRVFPAVYGYSDCGVDSILSAKQVTLCGSNNKRIIDFELGNGDYTDYEHKDIVFKHLLNEKIIDKYDLIPVLDDRMFVLSVVRDNSFSELNKVEPNRVYEYVFVDTEGNCSCQDDDMLREELSKHLYTRWKNYGTWHGITEYSFVCATNEDIYREKDVINPFITEYVSLAKLALSQRASLVKLETEVTDITKSSDEYDGTTFDSEAISAIWKKFIVFQNEMYITEATFQTQGVELFDMLKDYLKLSSAKEILEDELRNLHDKAKLDSDEEQADSDKKMNLGLNVIGVLAIVSALTDGSAFIEKLHVSSDFGDWSGWPIIVGESFANVGLNGKILNLISLLVIVTICLIGTLAIKNSADNIIDYLNKKHVARRKKKNKIPYKFYKEVMILIIIILLIIMTIIGVTI